MFSCFPLSGVSARCVFPAWRFLRIVVCFVPLTAPKVRGVLTKTDSKSLTPLHPQLQIDQFVDGTKASQKSVLVADDDVPPSPSPSLTLSLVSNMRPKRTLVSGASIGGKKQPAMKVRRLLTAVTNVAQKTIRCLEAMKSSKWRAGLSDDVTPPFFWDSIKVVAEAEVLGGERTSSDTPSRDQSRWAESSTTAENPRVRSSRSQLAPSARVRHRSARIVKRGGHLRRHRLHGQRPGQGSLESRPVQAKVTCQYQEPCQ